MPNRTLQKSQVGFHFSLGNLYTEDGDYNDDYLYFESCAPAVEAALRNLPFWKQTQEEANDAMHVPPYELCLFDSEMECIGSEMTCSFWVESLRIALFPQEHVVAMRDAIESVMAAKFVKAQRYTEYRETGHDDIL